MGAVWLSGNFENGADVIDTDTPFKGETQQRRDPRTCVYKEARKMAFRFCL